MIANLSRSHLNYVKSVQRKCRQIAKEKGLRIRRVGGKVNLYAPGEQPREFYGFLDLHDYLQGGEKLESKTHRTSDENLSGNRRSSCTGLPGEREPETSKTEA